MGIIEIIGGALIIVLSIIIIVAVTAQETKGGLGSALAGEDSLTAALREAKEELGIELCPENGYLFKTAIRQYRNFPDFLDIWVFNQDFPIESVVLQAGETCGAKWASSEEILEMEKNGEFIPMNVYPYLKELFEN